MNNKRSLASNRIEWIDVFKGLLMILIVVGHATGKYNSYIYQFHVGAFFWISGFTYKRNERSLISKSIEKIYSLILPMYAAFLLMLSGIWLANKAGLHSYLFETEYVGWFRYITDFFKGYNSINLLGATWFLTVLFWIFILEYIADSLIKEKWCWVRRFISLCMFWLGYLCIEFSQAKLLIVIILISQFYFELGRIFNEKELLNKCFRFKGAKGICGVISVLIFYAMSNVLHYSMDFASGNFGTPLKGIVCILNGSILFYLIANVVVKYASKLKNILIYVGQNTMGILLFHFAFFKAAYLLLWACGEIPVGDIRYLCPQPEVGNKWWWLITAIAVSGSLILWHFIIKIDFLRKIFGSDKKIKLFLKDRTKKCSAKINSFVSVMGCILLLLVIIREIDPESLYNNFAAQYLYGYTVEGKYEDGFLDQTAQIRYESDADIVSLELYNTEYTVPNQVTITLNKRQVCESILKQGINEIQIELSANTGIIELSFAESFIPAECSDSSDRRRISCKMTDLKFIYE